MLAAMTATLLGLNPSPAWAQQKLVFKDGTTEDVAAYEVKGDRVRFKSIDRNEWEEVPLSLVDLVATKKLNAKNTEELRELQKIPLGKPGGKSRGHAGAPPEKRVEDVEVAPGVKLSNAYGVYVWDGKQILQLSEAGARSQKDKRNIIINMVAPLPIMKQKTYIQLDGPTSDRPLHTSSPVFYAYLPDGRGGDLSLFRMIVTKSARVLKEVAHSQITGSDSERSQTFIFTPSIRVAENVYKIFPTKPLEAGEYCLLELTPEQNQFETLVWDFSVVK